MEIRSANKSDVGRIHSLHTRSVRELCISHYDDHVINKWLEGRTPDGYVTAIENGEMFLAIEGDEVLGFGHVVPGEVKGLFVRPDSARMGVGSFLLKYGLDRAQVDQQSEVRLVATLNAERFYLSKGFIVVKRSSVRRNGVDIAIVEMSLSA